MGGVIIRLPSAPHFANERCFADAGDHRKHFRHSAELFITFLILGSLPSFILSNSFFKQRLMGFQSFRFAHHLRRFSNGTGSHWYRSPLEVYKPGVHLTLALCAHNESLEIQIVKAFTPFTSSVVLLVQAEPTALQLPSPFILKVADRRLAPIWDFDRENNYQARLQYHVETFGTTIIPKKDEELPLWIHMLKNWEFYESSHIKEREAYKWFTEAQKLELIPRFYSTAQLRMDESACHQSLTHIKCLLFEYIYGRTMSSFRPGIDLSAEEAEVMSQCVLQLGRDLRRYGVSHNDIHVDNIIIRSTNNRPVLIDWGNANSSLADLPLQQRWTHYSMWFNYHYCIRYMLRYGNNGDQIVSGGVWHRYRTPVSDIEQFRQVQEIGWERTNYKISQMSNDEKERFYDEDKFVDDKHGLRWKVKKGLRTRMIDDPVPIM
ncbi:hypothetical protein E4T56_gene778 [Termitomyces sp. T112]|nr:hypothetical protein E4T56_gene778 [Termitomyces sp. T112]